MKAPVENPRGSLEKLSPKENVEGAHTVLRGSVRAPKVLQPRVYPRKISREPSHCPAAHYRHPRDSTERTVFPNCPKDFNSCSDYQNC